MADPVLTQHIDQATMMLLREALAASWDRHTAYGGVEQAGNPAFGQCYPTAKVVQHFYPAAEIIKGTVWTGRGEEVHFWNGLPLDGAFHHVDLSWQQFPAESIVREWSMIDRDRPNDNQATIYRCELLLGRVESYLRGLSARQWRCACSFEPGAARL